MGIIVKRDAFFLLFISSLAGEEKKYKWEED
jgi:hypothetical protein